MPMPSEPDTLPFAIAGRTYLRFPVCDTMHLNVKVAFDEECLVGSAEDLSASGIGLILDRTVAVGTEVTLRLWNTVSLHGCLRPAQVVHTSPRREGGYLIGCQFDHPIGREHVIALTR